MDKKIFVNDEIFESDGDYIIGGFETDKVEDFNFGYFEDALRNRIAQLVEVYLGEATLFNIELKLDNPEEEARKDMALVISDNLGITPEFFDTDTLVDAIMDSPQTRGWLFGIKSNIKEFEKNQSLQKPKYSGVYNQSVELDTDSEKYQDAEYFTNTATIEQVIEQLSTIEL